MRDALKAYLSLASGVTEVTRQRALTAARALVQQGEATAEQVTALAEDVVAQSRANREAVTALAKFEVDRALGRVGLASADEVGDLAARVRVLEDQLRTLRASAAKAPDGPAQPTKKAPSKRAAAKKAAPERAPAGAPRTPAKAAPEQPPTPAGGSSA